MDNVPKATEDDDNKMPDLMCTFYNWLVDSGRKDGTAKSYMKTIIALYDEDGRSIEGLLSEDYYSIILHSARNRRGNNQRSASLKCLKTFWDQQGNNPATWQSSLDDKRFHIKRPKADCDEAPLNGEDDDGEGVVRRPPPPRPKAAPKEKAAAKPAGRPRKESVEASAEGAGGEDAKAVVEQVRVSGLSSSHKQATRVQGVYSKMEEAGDEGRPVYRMASSSGKECYICFSAEKGMWRICADLDLKDKGGFAKNKDKNAEKPWKVTKPWKVYDGSDFEEVSGFKVAEVKRRAASQPTVTSTLPESILQELLEELGEPPATKAPLKVGHDKPKAFAHCSINGERLKISYSRCWNSQIVAERVLLLCAAKAESSSASEVEVYAAELGKLIHSKADEASAPSSQPLLQIEKARGSGARQQVESETAADADKVVDAASSVGSSKQPAASSVDENAPVQAKRKHENDSENGSRPTPGSSDAEPKKRKRDDEEDVVQKAAPPAAQTKGFQRQPPKLGRAAAKMSVRTGMRCSCHYLVLCPETHPTFCHPAIR
mmetsp:Transcript_42845/g.100461  ORF Transcript_42845/g.100461 Transcript_42845/m.100461 type:complete len:546 (+) Transcript_42845:121-1758(+)